MITALQAAHALQTCVVAVIAITVLFKILPMMRLDCFRQNMFSVRDELFDYAAAGNISFNDPAYVLLRQQMNGMIRYGHQLTLFRVLVTWVIRAMAGGNHTFLWHDSWERALSNVKSEEVRQKLRWFHDRSAAVAAKHLVSGSLVLWCALCITAFCLSVRGAALSARQLLQAVIEEEAVCSLA